MESNFLSGRTGKHFRIGEIIALRTFKVRMKNGVKRVQKQQAICPNFGVNFPFHFNASTAKKNSHKFFCWSAFFSAGTPEKIDLIFNQESRLDWMCTVDFSVTVTLFFLYQTQHAKHLKWRKRSISSRNFSEFKRSHRDVIERIRANRNASQKTESSIDANVFDSKWKSKIYFPLRNAFKLHPWFHFAQENTLM